MRDEVKTLHLDTYEEGAVIEGLNKLRTEQLDGKKSADFVSDLMLKIIRTPAKKGKPGTLRSSAGISQGEEERRSERAFDFSRKRVIQSPRRRDETR